MKSTKRAPRNCPVCNSTLALTRLSCDDCGTELAGHFPTCEYCSLSESDRETLQVFLTSRGNMKEVERHLSVSYPTARARFDSILRALGFEPFEESESESPAGAPSASMEVLEALSRGDLDVDAALKKLS